jgi:uncharacterized protein YdhG (YjbR/CyaY superfamily)
VGRTVIDDYLDGVDPVARRTLDQLRRDILAVVPDAEEVISYKLPGFRVSGGVIAGFAAFARHLSYLPHSGNTLAVLGPDHAGYTCTKGSLHFAYDEPLPADLVARLVEARLVEIAARGH